MFTEVKFYLAIALFIILPTAGWFASDWYGDSEKLKAEKALADANAKAALLEQKLGQQHTQVVTQTITLKQKVPVYVDRIVYVPGAGTTARPVYYLTAGELRLWNQALAVPNPAPEPAGTAVSTDLADTYTLTGVSLQDAFGNHIVNAARCIDLENQVVGWQAWWATVPH